MRRCAWALFFSAWWALAAAGPPAAGAEPGSLVPASPGYSGARWQARTAPRTTYRAAPRLEADRSPQTPRAVVTDPSLAHRIDYVSPADPNLCEMDIGAEDGIFKGDALAVFDPQALDAALGEVTVVALSPKRSAGRGSPCRVGLLVAPVRSRNLQRVVVEGVGLTAQEALDDAFRKAVRSVAGGLSQAETLVENDELLVDRVTTFSDGFVSAYDELDQRVEEGLIHRRIVAVVQRDDIALAMRQTASSSVQARSLYAEAVTKRERARSARDLLRSTLAQLPANILRAELPRRPAVLQSEGPSTIVAPELVVTIDPDRYRAVADRLIAVAGPLARRQGTIEATHDPVPATLQKQRSALFARKFLSSVSSGGLTGLQPDFGEVLSVHVTRITGLPEEVGRAEPDPGTLLVVRQSEQWQWFELDETLSVGGAELAIRFCDERRRPVAVATAPLGPWLPGVALRPPGEAEGPLQTVVVSPFFLVYVGDGYRIPQLNTSESLTLRGQYALTDGQLARVHSVDAVVTSVASTAP